MIDRVNLMEFLRLVSWVLCAFVCVFVMVNALQFFSHRWPRLLQWHSRWIGWSDSDNDLEAIRQVLPTPSEIRQMSDDDALTWLRTLLPDNILSDQLESVSHTFILIPKMFLNFLSEELQYLSNVSWQSLETRTTRLDPRSSKLEYFEYRVLSRVLRVSSRVLRVSSRVDRVSSRVDRVSSRVVRVSSREDKEFIAWLIFQSTVYVCMSILLVYFRRARSFPSRDSRGSIRLSVNRLAYEIDNVLSLGRTSFNSELIMVRFRVTVLNTMLSII